jgi:hypothetical protein
MYLYGGGHSKVIAEILESMGKTISVSLMIINALKKLGTKVEKGYGFRAKIPFQF